MKLLCKGLVISLLCGALLYNTSADAEDPELPRVIALTNFKQDSDQLNEFRDQYSPAFEIATISLTDFYRLTYAHGYPRLAYINEGVVQSVWERDFMPDVNRLRNITQIK